MVRSDLCMTGEISLRGRVLAGRRDQRKSFGGVALAV